MTETEIRALATRFFDCIEAGDVDGLIACYAPDAAIWHNTDGETQGPEDNRRVLTGLVKSTSTSASTRTGGSRSIRAGSCSSTG